MPASLLDLLRCPFCGGRLNPAKGKGSLYDVLHCRCADYPIVAGIPVLKKRTMGAGGARIGDIVSLIRAGSHQEALNLALMPPPPASVTRAPRSVNAAPQWKHRAEALFSTPVDAVTAFEFIDFYFRRSGMASWEGYCYFLLRFGIPRHLVPLSVAELLTDPRQPVLDLACGFGHSTRGLIRRAGNQPVIGIDGNFFALFVARHWIAPNGQFVCCAADGALPLPDTSVSAVFCTDAFQSFKNKLACIRELRRLVSTRGFIVLASLRNRLVNESAYSGMSPLTPEGYTALVADMPHCLIADAAILARYLQKKGPALARPGADDRGIEREAWLTLIASYRDDVFQDYGTFGDWPHADGHLTVNPLYKSRMSDEAGTIELRRVYPSTWYRRENEYQHDHYMPETVSTGPAVLSDLFGGERTAEIDALIARCVVVGVPHRYLPDNFSRDDDIAGTQGSVGGTLYIAEIAVSDLIDSVIPSDAVCIVVDDGAAEHGPIMRGRAVPFLERKGQYGGRPPDDATAIRELERLRASGATFLIFTAPAMWWLDYYAAFSRHLYATFHCIVQSHGLVAFDLRRTYTDRDAADLKDASGDVAVDLWRG